MSESKILNRRSKSYKGGCPANVEENLAGGAAADNALQLDFAIPESIQPRKYTLT
ncbi:unnamed protein product [Penicillium nalgiovense]|nr:unnamed protein product [Penicillium nalgiovense]